MDLLEWLDAPSIEHREESWSDVTSRIQNGATIDAIGHDQRADDEREDEWLKIFGHIESAGIGHGADGYEQQGRANDLFP